MATQRIKITYSTFRKPHGPTYRPVMLKGRKSATRKG